MTFVSDDRGFALGTVGCGPRRCLALVGTADGGRRWRRLTAPTRAAGAVYDTCPHGIPCVGQVRFATPLIGYAFAPSLLITADGGRHWRLLSRAAVSSLEAADGTVVRVASKFEGCSGAPAPVEAAAVGGSAWHRLPAPAIENICPPVLYRQGERLVLAGYGNPAGGVRATAQIDRSADGGKTWQSGPDRCGGRDGYASTLTMAPPGTLVELCLHQAPRHGSYGPAWIRVSTDNGATFGPDRPLPVLPVPKGTITGYQIAAASSRRLLIGESGTSGSRLLRSTNGGRTWAVVLSVTSAQPLLVVGFEDPLTARVAQGNTVWTTRDGGRTWRPDHFLPAHR